MMRLIEFLAIEYELGAEIFFAHDGVLGQLLGSALKQDFAIKKQISAVGDGKRFRSVVVGDEDADVLFLKAVNYPLNILYGDGVNTGKRLVKHDELGVDGKAPRNFGASAFASGELVAEILAHVLQRKFVKQTFKLFFLIFNGGFSHLEDGTDIVFHRKLAEHGRLLREITDAVLGTAVHRILGDVHVVDVYLPLVGDDKAGGHVECGGFAGAVRAQQAHNLSLCHINGHMIDHGALAVFLHEVLGTEHHVVGGAFVRCVGRGHGRVGNGRALLGLGIVQLVKHGGILGDVLFIVACNANSHKEDYSWVRRALRNRASM